MRPSGADDRIRDLEEAVARLSARLDRLEARDAATASEAGEASDSIAASNLEAGGDARAASPGWLGLVGRTFIVLGGAFLLRALTESGQLPAAAGVWIGLAYAALWLTMASRTSGPSTFFHGVAALMVGLPLILEAALKFRVFPAATGAAVLGTLVVTALAVAWRRGQRMLAVVSALGGVATAFALAFGTGTMLPSVLALLAIGGAALWVSYARRWHSLTWPTAAAADLAVIFLALRAVATPPRDGPLTAQLAHALLILVYLGSFVIRVLLHERDVRLFEVGQTTAALAIGLAGATAIAHAHGMGVTAIAIPCLIAAGLFYVQTFARVVPRRGFGPEFYYVGMTALALALVGVSLVFPYPARPAAVAGGALIVSLVAWRFGHPMLALQGAIAAVVASAESGLVTFTASVWLTHSQAWPPAGAPIWIVLAAVLAALCIPRAVHEDEPPMLASVARIALSVALVAGAGSLLIIGLGHLIPGAATNAGVMATMKTVVLAASAAGLAIWAARRDSSNSDGWRTACWRQAR